MTTVSYRTISSGYYGHGDTYPLPSDYVYFYNQPSTITITFNELIGTPTARPLVSISGGYLNLEISDYYGQLCITYNEHCEPGYLPLYNPITGVMTGNWDNPEAYGYVDRSSFVISRYDTHYNLAEEWGTIVPLPSTLLLLVTGLVLLLGWRKRA